jgi:hypothetical protein
MIADEATAQNFYQASLFSEIVTALACIFHEGGCSCHVFSKRINLIAMLLFISRRDSLYLFTFRKNVASQFERSALSNSLAITLRPIAQPV